MARVSNAKSPRLSVQRIDAAKATHFHVSLNTLRPGLFKSHSSRYNKSKTFLNMIFDRRPGSDSLDGLRGRRQKVTIQLF